MRYPETESTLWCSAQRFGQPGHPAHIHSGRVSGLAGSGHSSHDSLCSIHSWHPGSGSGNAAPGEDLLRGEHQATLRGLEERLNGQNSSKIVIHSCFSHRRIRRSLASVPPGTTSGFDKHSLQMSNMTRYEVSYESSSTA